MSHYRNKLLISLSNTNKEYHNTSAQVTRAFDLANISPIPMVPLSSSVLEEYISEVRSHGSDYAELLTVSAQSPELCLVNYKQNEEEDSKQLDNNFVMVNTKALIHSPPYTKIKTVPIQESSFSPKLRSQENRIQIISSQVIVPAHLDPVQQDGPLDLSKPVYSDVLRTKITVTRKQDLIREKTQNAGLEQITPCALSFIPSQEQIYTSCSILHAASLSDIEKSVLSPPSKKQKLISTQSNAVLPCKVLNQDEEDLSECYKIKKNKRERDPFCLLNKQREKHPMLDPCNCKKQCLEKISDTERSEIWTQFWNMDRQRRRDFISRQVERVPTLREKRGSRRQNTLKWSLSSFSVCKTFFLHTLGFTNDESVQSVLKSNYLTGNKHPNINSAPDRRGRYKPSTAYSDEYQKNMENFIMQYNPVSSHYTIEHAPNRKYLPVGMSFSTIYKDFKEHCEEKGLKVCSWPHFHSMIKKLNLSTAELPQDICTKCRNHEEEHKTKPRPCNCDSCKDLGKHLENKKSSRRDLKIVEERCNQSEDKEVVYTVDMQKAICMPILTSKDYYFSRKLVLFNESFVPPGKNKKAVCVLWHEGESGRKAHNVASSFVYFLLKHCRDKKHVNLFLDNCNAQNKNKILLSTLVRVINDKKTSIDTITLEYFEPGHTYMAADTVHAAITKKLKSAGEVYDFDDFTSKIQKSRKNLDVDVIDHNDMYLFKNDTKVQFPENWNLQKLKVIEFRRGAVTIFVKNDYNQDFNEIHFLKKKIETELQKKAKEDFDLFNNIKKENGPRGVNEQKKKDLLSLCKSMPSTRKIFFENLVVSDVPDLTETLDL